MAKEIILKPGRTFGEFSLLTSYTDKDCNINNVSLETKLADNLTLGIPLLSAAMASVTGYEMALALGKERGLAVLPARLPIEEQIDIVKKIKSLEMGFVEDPITARNDKTIEQVLAKMDKYGHSKIPIVDLNNVFEGMFLRQHYWETGGHPQDQVTSIMIPFYATTDTILYCNEPDISIDDAKAKLTTSKRDYIVVLDEQNRLVKLAFTKDEEKIKIASAITTHKGWEERVKENVKAGVDLIVIDTSDAYNYFAENVIKNYKKMETGIPICAGNVITYDGAKMLMDAGADIVKVGMSSGSICTTQREKAVGRAPMTALIEADKARRDIEQKRYIPIIVDGGISSAGDMVIALTIADAIMMGNYFNRFFEAAGDKFNKKGDITRLESEIANARTYGEGSEEARNLARYGHADMLTFFPEGVSGTVPYAGLLKPNVKADMLRVKAALVNAGCMNLKELRENAVIELMSPYSREVVTETHDIEK